MGIIGGVILVYMMGSKAIIGAAACSILGLITYYSYGKSRAHPMLTPWRTVRTEFTNADKYEREKRWLVFHTAAAKQSHPDYLNESEFVHAMEILSPNYDSDYVRKIFHEIDTNGDGVVDVDEFLEGMEDTLDEQE
ncbi:MAG: EF-hand domain-containing protein [Candidatus Poseidoniaceae archaeon]|nr:EF-hand domain-containing protein [Candidatus Poseidoniaceae archaeon]